jgi:hypothetical protein
MATHVPKFRISMKHIQIDRSEATILIAAATAATFLMFSIVSAKALLAQRSYQVRVISKKQAALKQLDENIKELDKLVASYTAFANQEQNVLSGSSKIATGNLNGDNPKIVLDALPSKYDFPAIATSLEAILKERQISIAGIAGTDDEVNQQVNQSSPNPIPIEVPFEVGIDTTYPKAQEFLSVLQRSIRPIYINSLILSGEDGALQAKISAKTYYQPSKSFNITEEDVQ